jgi:glycosyltransferase involved in cell wall biosynthesis
MAAGVYVQGFELCAWAIDQAEPLRPVTLALIADGVPVFEAWTDPHVGMVAIATGYRLTGHRTIEFLVDGVGTAGSAYGGAAFWRPAAVRNDLTDFLTRTRKTFRDRTMRRELQRDVAGTLARFARIDADRDPEAAPPGVPAPVRYLAQRARVPLASGGPLAIANWIVSEVLEDPHRREVFCLDAPTEAILNEPAFNTRALRSDVSLALLCFWRRHYRDLDIFSDDGLRRIQYKFATAPFITIKNNQRLISSAMRERLTALSGQARGGELPWSWYWTYLHQDQGNADQLKDASYAASLSFREVAGDALDPGRLSFNPAYWHSYWSAWAAGEGDGFSRFDMALIALLAEAEYPEAILAESGPEPWRQALIDHYYRAMPGLASLSLACKSVAAPLPPRDYRRCDLAIVGWMNGSGLARNTNMFVEALSPLRPLVFDAHSGRCVNAASPEDADVRARTVVLCVNADAVPEVLGRFAALCADAHVIGFFLWETDRPPELHRFGTLAVDEIWTPTHYVADAYRQMATVPVHVVGKGLRAPDPRTWTPFVRRFKREGGPFTFLYLAEFASSIVRKNPLDGVRAFLRAFDRGNQNVRLLLKMRSIQPGHWSNIDGYWEELEELIAGDSRIELVVGDLPEEEYWALLGSADALLALHRGEGFGYPIADAMMLGRPVVACGYSGPADFCNEETAFVVGVDVVPTPPEHLRSSGNIGHWGIPRLDSAVAAMRRVVTDRAEAAKRAKAGQEWIRRSYDFARWRESLVTRIAATLPQRHAAGPMQLTLTPAATPNDHAPNGPTPYPAG